MHHKPDKFAYATGMLEALLEHAILTLHACSVETRLEAIDYLESRYAHVQLQQEQV